MMTVTRPSSADSQFYDTLKIYYQGLLSPRVLSPSEHTLMVMVTSVRARSAAEPPWQPAYHSGTGFGGGGAVATHLDGVSGASDGSDEKRVGCQMATTSV